MALIRCSECGQEISDNAQSCPHCGNIIHGQTIQIANPPGQTFKIEPELTSKAWKKAKIVGWCIIVAGFILGPALGAMGNNPNATAYDIFGIAFIGVIALVIAHIGAWYSDKRTR